MPIRKLILVLFLFLFCINLRVYFLMTTLHLPFISVQADWDQVAQEVASGKSPNTSFWIACYITGYI